MENTAAVRYRELGVEFGELAGALESHSYPFSTEEFIAEFGEHVVELSNGEESVGDILESCGNETYESPIEAREALLNLVDSRAIGRKYYSDRTPPAPGEARIDDQLSF